MGVPAESMIPVEARIVFLSAAGDWADDPIREALTRPLRWSLLLALARREGATSVLLRRLRRLGTELPSDPLGALEQFAAIQDFRMTLLEDRLAVLVRRITELGVPVVLLKGAAVAAGSFGSFRDRPMGDLDILVPEEAASRVHALALNMDWVRPARGLHPGLYEDLHHLLPLDAAGGLGFGLEIHRDLFPAWSPFLFSAADVWREARELSMPGGGQRYLVPSLEHQLLHTSLHYAWSHCFGRGAWRLVRDLEVLVGDPDFDPATFADLALEGRGATCVYWTLELYESLAGRSIAAPVRDALSHAVPDTFRGPLRRYLVSEAIGSRGVPGTRRFRRALWTLAIRPGRSGHGRARPWTGERRWDEMESPVAPDGRNPSGLTSRLRGFSRYSTALVLGARRIPFEGESAVVPVDQY